MTINEFDHNTSTILCEMLNQIDIGLLFIRFAPEREISANRCFKMMAKGREEELIQRILDSLAENDRMRIRNDIELSDGSSIGYTLYKLSPDNYLAFTSDISQKKIFFESMGENLFLDRLLIIISEISHEIGNPLNVLSTTLQVLRSNLSNWNDEKKGEFIESATEEVNRLAHYLDRMRDYSTVSKPNKRPHFLKNLVEKAVSQNSPLLEKKKIAVSFLVDEDARVLMDEYIFYQVMRNLFLNSIDSLPENGRISIELEEVSDFFAKLMYKNNGPSIPEEIRDKILSPFFSTKEKGRGIGMAVCLKQMILNGGSLKVEPPEGEWGAKFALYLPIY